MAAPIIIGIAGPAGCGKDTLALHLGRAHNFERHSFAAPLRRMVEGLIGLNNCHWDDRAWKEAPLPHLGISPRRLLQTLGTEWGRSLLHDFWLRTADTWLADCRAAYATHQVQPAVVFSDVRFENEAQWIRAHGGQVWHLRRPGTVAVEAHVSEAGVALISPEPLICNSGTPEQLFELADAQMDRLYQVESDPAQARVRKVLQAQS